MQQTNKKKRKKWKKRKKQKTNKDKKTFTLWDRQHTKQITLAMLNNGLFQKKTNREG